MSIYPKIDYDALTNAELGWVQRSSAGNVELNEVSAPSGTASGRAILFVKSSDSDLYFQDDAGVETNLLSGSGAPTDAQYVVLAANGSLSAERVLAGTPGQVIFTDGGANGNITASLPQSIDTTSVVTFNTLNATSANITGSATIGTYLRISGSAQIVGSATIGDLRLVTDLAVLDGGTGASTAGGARTNLGLVIGTDVQAFDAQLTDIAAIAPSASAFVGSNATNLIARSAAQTRGDLGLVIGTNVQAWDNDLDDIAALTHAASAFIVSNGTDWVRKDQADARADLGLGSIATQAANNVSITGGSVTGITDLVVADGGSGVSSFTAYAVLAGGTAATQPLQNVSGVGASGQVLTSNGAGTLPTWQAASGGSSPTASIQALVYAHNSVVRTGDGQFFFHVDSRFAGYQLRQAHARHLNALTAGTGTVIDVVNTGTSGTAAAGTAMFTRNIYIDVGESGSNTAVNAPVISNTGSAVLENDLIRIDVDGAGTTGSAEGLIITLGFRAP